MVALALWTWASWVCANHVRFHAVERLSDNQIAFRISWDNAWNLSPENSPGNHDAVWVFGKVFFPRRHLGILSAFSPELDVFVPENGTGVMLKTKSYGQTGVANAACTLTVSMPPGTGSVRFYAVEMVYVPAGPFFLGDGASKFALSAGNGEPLEVKSEAALNPGNGAGDLAAGAAHLPDAPLPEDFPKGFADFYVMKYEVSQRQYADFLNSLTLEEQARHMNTEADVGANPLLTGNPRRNGVVVARRGDARPCLLALDGDGDGVFDEPEDGASRACSGIAWPDAAAFLDWAALRPMTELEFEKVCRGPEYPLPKGFPWGTPFVKNAVEIVADGTSAETVADVPEPGQGLANHGGRFDEPFVWGPLRCGFAARETSERVAAGAGFFGVHDLGGNLWEPCVSVKFPVFDGAHGDGELTEGLADVPHWPGPEGVILRGGGWNSLVLNDFDYEFRDLAVSDRFYFNLVHNVRRNTAGIRGVISLR